MRDKVKHVFFMIMIVTFSFSFVDQGFGQGKVNISAGIGISELLNIGVRYQLDQFQIGLSVGSLPLKDESIISVLGDVRYHFAGLSRFSDLRSWYARIGLNYLRDETESMIDKYLYLHTRIGRDFNITDKIGIDVDAGVIFQLSNEKIMKKPSGSFNLDLEYPVLPGIGIGFFYRF